MLKEILFQSIKEDFFNLFEMANHEQIYGCAIYTDEDFLASSLAINTVGKGKQFQSKNDYWDTYCWSFYSYNFPNIDKLEKFNQEVIDFYKLNENKDFELCKKEIFYLLIEGLKYLKEKLREIMNVDDICFFITVSDGDMEYIEDYSAKQINSGYILEDFLARFT